MLLLLLVAVAAGCGGGDGGRATKAEYERAVNAAGLQLSQVFGGIDSGTGHLGRLSAQVGRGRETLDAVTARLEDLRPPKSAEPAHEQLLRGLRQLSADLGRMKRAADTRNERRVQSARRALAGPATTILDALRQLQRKGYRINRGTS